MDNTDIKVSVVMPIYNASEYLSHAIDCVLSQTLRDIELICIDDGSTDSSLEIIKSYQESDGRVRIVTENNAGPSVARNKGIVRARGEYIIFLDADDFFEPTLLELLYDTACRQNLDVAVARFDIYNNKLDKYIPAVEEEHANIFVSGAVVSKNEFPDYILQSTTGYVWNKLFRTSFVRDKELTFAQELYVFEDVHFVCTALSLAERVSRIDGVLIHHRVYSDQSRAKLFRKYYAQVPVVYQMIKEFLVRRGMYVPLTRSYLNLSAGRCYKIYNLLWNEAKDAFWNLLHSEYAELLGWYQQDSTVFESADVRDFVANVGIYTHEQYQDRVSKGRRLKIERMKFKRFKKRLKAARANEKMKDASDRAKVKIVKPLRKLKAIFKKKENK